MGMPVTGSTAPAAAGSKAGSAGIVAASATGSVSGSLGVEFRWRSPPPRVFRLQLRRVSFRPQGQTRRFVQPSRQLRLASAAAVCAFGGRRRGLDDRFGIAPHERVVINRLDPRVPARHVGEVLAIDRLNVQLRSAWQRLRPFLSAGRAAACPSAAPRRSPSALRATTAGHRRCSAGCCRSW